MVQQKHCGPPAETRLQCGWTFRSGCGPHPGDQKAAGKKGWAGRWRDRDHRLRLCRGCGSAHDKCRLSVPSDRCGNHPGHLRHHARWERQSAEHQRRYHSIVRGCIPGSLQTRPVRWNFMREAGESSGSLACILFRKGWGTVRQG